MAGGKMPRTHNREHFFKYVTADTAEKILESGKLLWRAPHLFNDPFDHQVTYRFSFNGEEAARKLYEAQAKFIFGDDEPVIIQQKPLGLLSLLLRKQQLKGAAKEDALRSLRSGANETAGRLEKYQIDLNNTLIDLLSHSRVLCVSETNENVVMWSHYGEEHRGAVIKLHCIDAVDDNLLIARPVTYTETFPDFLSVDDWVAEHLGLKANDYQSLAFNLAYIKHKDWGYEREWRIHIPLLPREPVGDGTSLYVKDPTVFGALYLGCRMPMATQQRLIEVARRRYPHMEIFRASQSKSSFTLEFERIQT